MKSIKYILWILGLASVMVPALAFAQSVNISNSTALCQIFAPGLEEGSTGTAVLELQQFLNRDPATEVAASGPGSAGQETTYFGPATMAAVVAFQNKYANDILTPLGLSEGTGIVGVNTAVKLNALNCTTSTGPAPVSPSPVSSSTPVMYSVTPDTAATGTAITITGRNFTPTGNTILIGPGAIPNVPSADGKTLSFILPQNFGINCNCPATGGMCACPALAFVVEPDTYTIEVKNANGQSSGFGFTVISSTSNLPPVLQSITGSTTLSTAQVGTWIINATDPESNPLQYEVAWGDGATTQFQTSNSFIHQYYLPGTYTATFKVKTAASAIAFVNATISVH